MIKISYAIPFKNEHQLKDFLPNLIKWQTESKLAEYETVLLHDMAGDQQLYNDIIRDLPVRHTSGKFKGHFADWKNELNEHCNPTDWIIQLDADESITYETFLEYEKIVVGNHEGDVECMLVPRWNIVNGLTEEDCKRWGWDWKGESGINFPDYQYRIYRGNCKWRNKVHEIIDATIYAKFPPLKKFCILHVKSIERQRKQNDYYSTL